jgi:glycine oxidase
MSVAGELARRGARVKLLDARQPGQGATQASAGMLAPFTEAELGTALSDLCVEALSGYDEAVARVRHDGGVDFEYARTGTVEVALDEAGKTHLRASLADLQRRGVRCRWDDASVTARSEPALTRTTLGSLVVPTHGFVAVMPFLEALMAAGVAYGVKPCAGTRAMRVRRLPNGLEVLTDHEAVRATDVVVCCGSWSASLIIEGGSRLPIHPVRGQLLELKPRARDISRILWGPRCYLVPWSNGHLLVGATVEDVGFDERTTANGVAALVAAATELVPSLADATFVGARAGLRPASDDGLPVIGPSSDVPGIFYATGHYRNGVLLAPLTATIVADFLLDGRSHSALPKLAPSRFRQGGNGGDGENGNGGNREVPSQEKRRNRATEG